MRLVAASAVLVRCAGYEPNPLSSHEFHRNTVPVDGPVADMPLRLNRILGPQPRGDLLGTPLQLQFGLDDRPQRLIAREDTAAQAARLFRERERAPVARGGSSALSSSALTRLSRSDNTLKTRLNCGFVVELRNRTPDMTRRNRP